MWMATIQMLSSHLLIETYGAREILFRGSWFVQIFHRFKNDWRLLGGGIFMQWVPIHLILKYMDVNSRLER